jgi:hypothetical protein
MRGSSDGQAIDICLDDLTDEIADVATAEADQFPSPNIHRLAFQPIEASIHLTVDGEAFTDFCYDSSNHTLVFGATASDSPESGCTEPGSVDLDPDTVVEIVYMRQEDC